MILSINNFQELNKMKRDSGRLLQAQISMTSTW
jgi:hypothetical protein